MAVGTTQLPFWFSTLAGRRSTSWSLRLQVCSNCYSQAILRTSTQAKLHNSSPSNTSSLQARLFSISAAKCKKSAGNPKSTRKSPLINPPEHGRHIPDNKHTRTIDSEPDPYDNSELQAAIDSTIARLKDGLTKSRDAGRVSVEMIEALPVDLNIKGEQAQGKSAHKERTNLGDVASVVPKGGRMMQVFCAEESHIKAITSSIQSSPHSLTPQANTDPHNPLVILVPVPPVTQETRNAAVAAAKKVMDKAALDVRNARGDAQKRFRKMELAKIVSPDELRKAHKKMEEVAAAGQAEVKKVHDAAVRALQSS